MTCCIVSNAYTRRDIETLYTCLDKMRSSLTRNVFRQILNNEPYIKCTRSIRPISTFLTTNTSSSSCNRRVSRAARWSVLQRQQRRTIFGFSGFSRKPARVLREAEFTPGLLVMMELRDAINTGTRKPKRQDLIEGWEAFLKYKEERREAVNSMEVVHLLRTLRYLKDAPKPEHPRLAKRRHLDKMEQVLAERHLGKMEEVAVTTDEPHEVMDEKALQDRYMLAKELVAEIDSRMDEETSTSGPLRKKNTMTNLVSQLMMTGHTQEAIDTTEEWVDKTMQDFDNDLSSKWATYAWAHLLRNIVRYGRDESVLTNVIDKMQKHGLHLIPAAQAAIVSFYIQHDDFDKVKYWYEQEVYRYESNLDGAQPSSMTDTSLLVDIFEFCSRKNKIDWGNTVFRKILNSNPDKLTWDALFLWVAATPGKGVDDIERMVGLMKKHNADRPEVVPDIATFNGLAKLAMSKNDPYLAERSLALALRLGIYPDAQTYILQMNYRIDAGDLSGVQATYSQLQAQEITDNEDFPVLNKYIRALCAVPNSNHNQINAVLTDLDERNARLEPATVTSLVTLYLQREELENIVDICNTHAFHFTKQEREPMIQAFVDFIFNHENDAGLVYDAYTVLRVNFDEIDRELRTKIMRDFFLRGRSDMGIHVFGHMRQHTATIMRPTITEYIACFEGLAATCDMQSLGTVHNMMKLDSSIDTNTTLYNALMLAYAFCGEPFRALDFWHDITISREGPNYRSLEIVFLVCEKRPFGDEIAKDIWSTMKRMEIEITRDVFSAYANSLAGHVKNEEAFALVEGGEVEFGIKPDAKM